MISYPLLLCLIGAIVASSAASAMVRGASEELSADARDRIFKSENKHAWMWRAAEWLGYALILVGMLFPTGQLFTKTSQRILTIAAGVALFCISNAWSAWHLNAIYKKEAPESKARRAAFHGAALVTLAEATVLVLVLWIVSGRLGWFQNSNTVNLPNEPAATSNDDVKWVDESDALKELELAGRSRDYVEGRVAGGSIRTRIINGKRQYHPADIAKLKSEKKDQFSE